MTRKTVLSTVIEQDIPWTHEYYTGIIAPKATVSCKIIRRTEPWTIICKPKAAIDIEGTVVLSLEASETMAIDYIPEKTNWDSYLYDVYLTTLDGNTNRIMQGTVCLIPKKRIKDSESRFT